jgi:hypothetical protein
MGLISINVIQELLEQQGKCRLQRQVTCQQGSGEQTGKDGRVQTERIRKKISLARAATWVSTRVEWAFGFGTGVNGRLFAVDESGTGEAEGSAPKQSATHSNLIRTSPISPIDSARRDAAVAHSTRLEGASLMPIEAQ